MVCSLIKTGSWFYASGLIAEGSFSFSAFSNSEMTNMQPVNKAPYWVNTIQDFFFKYVILNNMTIKL